MSIAAGHHTLAVGPLVVVDAAKGINEPRGIGIITPGVKPPEGGMDGVFADFERLFARKYDLVESYSVEDTKIVVVATGTIAGTVRSRR